MFNFLKKGGEKTRLRKIVALVQNQGPIILWCNGLVYDFMHLIR